MQFSFDTNLTGIASKIFIAFTFLLASAVCVSAQNNPYPNEVKKYKLFKNEKLKRLKTGISTGADVREVFGAACENECDYDQNWTVKFEYFSLENASPLYYLSETNLKPNPKYIGKLFSITLKPKFPFSFEKRNLSKKFKGIGGMGFDVSSSAGKRKVSSERYRDSSGLEYQILYETPLTDSGKEILKEREITLESIKYGTSDILIKKMFVKAR